MHLNNNDNAISSVIGTILIVVIVTVLASFTALSVYVYLQTLNPSYLLELSEKRLDPTTIQIINRGGPNVNDLNESLTYPFIVYINNVELAPIPPTTITKTIGSYGNYHANVGDRLKIVALFNANKKQIIYDGTV